MDFHITIIGTGSEEDIDALVKNASKYVKALQKNSLSVESASINSGHFLGGSRSLVEPEQTEIGDS